MANVFTKRNHYPMTEMMNAYRAFDETHPLSKRRAEMGGDVQTEGTQKTEEVYVEQGLTIPNPKYTLDTNYRIAFQRPQYHPDMPDDIKHARTAYNPYQIAAIGTLPGLYPNKYMDVPGAAK
jgi:hypothetical protein